MSEDDKGVVQFSACILDYLPTASSYYSLTIKFIRSESIPIIYINYLMSKNPYIDSNRPIALSEEHLSKQSMKNTILCLVISVS